MIDGLNTCAETAPIITTTSKGNTDISYNNNLEFRGSLWRELICSLLLRFTSEVEAFCLFGGLTRI